VLPAVIPCRCEAVERDGRESQCIDLESSGAVPRGIGWNATRSVGPPECQWLLRKEVIQPHLPVRLPCYDFTPIASPTFDGSLHKG
jgi:hypothetical protein